MASYDVDGRLARRKGWEQMPGIDYETIAREYGRHRRVHPGVVRALIERPNLTRRSRVAEIGCGTGNYVTAIHDATACVAIGIDPTSAMLDQARARSATVTWLLGRAESLPLEDESVDLLFSVDVIHHVGDREAFFREAMRVLSPDGLICTVTDSEDDILRRRPLSSHFPETVACELARYPPIGTLRDEMDRAGFGGIETTHVELAYELTTAQPYRDRAFSSLHLIPANAFERGIARLEAELASGPVEALSLYTLLWGRSGGGAPRHGTESPVLSE
jgi:ubiquinone/menaquinone biosynthesis C-methylase UbiE